MFEIVTPCQSCKSYILKPKKDIIIKSSGDLPRIELFARNVGLFDEGWDVWGNEV